VKVAISDCNAAEIRTSALAAPLGFGVIRPLKLETAEHLQDACCLLRLTYATSAAATASFFVVLRRLALRAFSSRFRRRRGLPFRVWCARVLDCIPILRKPRRMAASHSSVAL